MLEPVARPSSSGLEPGRRGERSDLTLRDAVQTEGVQASTFTQIELQRRTTAGARVRRRCSAGGSGVGHR